MQNTVLNVPVCTNSEVKTLKLTCTSDVAAFSNAWKYQVNIYNQRGHFVNLICDKLAKTTNIGSTFNNHDLAFIRDDQVMVRAGRFSFDFKVIENLDIYNLTIYNVMNDILPAIITAYIDARWQQGVNKATSELLEEIAFSIRSDMAHSQIIELFNKSKAIPTATIPTATTATTSTATPITHILPSVQHTTGNAATAPVLEEDKPNEAKPNEDVKDIASRFTLGRICKRSIALYDNVWQSGFIPHNVKPSGSVISGATFNTLTHYMNIHGDRKFYKLHAGDEIRVEMRDVVLYIKCNENYIIDDLPAWLRTSLVDIVGNLAYERLKLMVSSKFEDQLLNTAYSAHLTARQHRSLRAAILNASEPVKTTKPTKPAKLMTKHLGGFACDIKVLGINITRFGTVVRKCVVELDIPSTIDIKIVDVKKFGLVRITRSVDMTRFESRVMDAAFNINDGKLSVQIDAPLLAYYITYDDTYIHTAPAAIEFECLVKHN